MKNVVGLFKCESYETALLLEVFAKALSAIAFDTKSLRSKTVLLKPNMLGAYTPEMGITTDPLFVEAAIIFFKELGCKVWVGDSPNGIFPIEYVWNITGINKVCEKHGVIKKFFEREGSVWKDDILIAKPVLEADVLVNLPKLKTHGLTVLTIAAKNLYGCVPGLKKTKYHRDNIDRKKFGTLVARIAETVNPELNLVDAIISMQGNGPAAGSLIKTNLVIAGTNHNLVDVICARLLGLEIADVDFLLSAQELGFINKSDEITVVGESLESCIPKSFELPATFTKGMRDWWISKFVVAKIWSGISIKPKVNKKKCSRCFLCVNACPVEAIEKYPDSKRAPKILNSKCIGCYCCHEICPNKAIDLHESIGVRIGRFLGERRIKNSTSHFVHRTS